MAFLGSPSPMDSNCQSLKTNRTFSLLRKWVTRLDEHYPLVIWHRESPYYPYLIVDIYGSKSSEQLGPTRSLSMANCAIASMGIQPTPLVTPTNNPNAELANLHISPSIYDWRVTQLVDAGSCWLNPHDTYEWSWYDQSTQFPLISGCRSVSSSKLINPKLPNPVYSNPKRKTC